MKHLIIYAHPRTQGFCSAILKNVLQALKKEHIKPAVIDLYKDGYNPVLLEDEHYTAGNRNVSKENKKYQSMIAEADKLIFIYPVWWNGPPAILKGFFDRVLTPGYAYHFEGPMPIGHLKGKKAAVFITHGGPDIFTTFVLRDRGAKVVTKDTLGFCGIDAEYFKLGNARKYDEKEEQRVRNTVRKGLKFLA